MWKHYFGPGAEIYGVDISANASIIESQIHMIHGDQGDLNFLELLPGKIGRPIDILIDDGSHMNVDQLKTLALLYRHISPDGVYFCEDIQTSYQEQFGGGYQHPGSFITRMKEKIDELNAWCAEPDTEFEKTDFSRTTFGIYFYTYIVVIEKRPMDTVLRSPVVSGGVHVR